MYCGEQFSDVTKQYLCCFYEILDNMIEVNKQYIA